MSYIVSLQILLCNVLTVGLDYSLSSETSFIPLFSCMTLLWTESRIIPNVLNEVSINPIRCSSSSLIWPAQENKKLNICGNTYLCMQEQNLNWHAYYCITVKKGNHIFTKTLKQFQENKVNFELTSMICNRSRIPFPH